LRRITYRFSATFILVILNVTVYIYTSFLGNSFLNTPLRILRTYGQYNYAVLYFGWWWQLITSMFVHVNIAHLASNMFFLLIFGLRAEDFFNGSEYYLAYFASGLAGNLLTLLYPLEVTSAGASGAIFGLFGAVLIYMRKVIEHSILGAVLFAFVFFMITLSVGTNILAHLGGLVAGLGIGYLLAKSRKAQFIYRVSY
jgi:rhomboid protease GluP